jgi:hypothetical protein
MAEPARPPTTPDGRLVKGQAVTGQVHVVDDDPSMRRAVTSALADRIATLRAAWAR